MAISLRSLYLLRFAASGIDVRGLLLPQQERQSLDEGQTTSETADYRTPK